MGGERERESERERECERLNTSLDSLMALIRCSEDVISQETQIRCVTGRESRRERERRVREREDELKGQVNIFLAIDLLL